MLLMRKEWELNNFHKFVGWASRLSKKDGRDAHPTITIKIVSYLIRDPKSYLSPDSEDFSFEAGNSFSAGLWV